MTRPTSAPVSDGGFTLIELLVTVAVSGFAVTAVLGTFAAQQRSFESAESARSGMEAARDGTLDLERNLRELGFGLDPRYALDFRNYNCAAVPCRDKINGPDELVFYARDPKYRLTSTGALEGNAWLLGSASPTFTVAIKTGQRFLKGQVLFVACAGASKYTMATVDANTPVATADGNQNLTIAATVANDPYKENNYSDACYAAGGMAFLVNRYRYFIAGLTEAGASCTPPAAGCMPWLTLDTGTDLNADGTVNATDYVPIARGIEDMQVTYTLRRSVAFVAPDADRDWIIGNTAGTQEEPDPALVQPATYPYRTKSDEAAAYNLHPGNIRQIRVTLAVRAPRQDNAPAASWTGDRFLLFENRNVAPTDLGRLRRYPTTTVVNLRNMTSRSPFIF